MCHDEHAPDQLSKRATGGYVDSSQYAELEPADSKISRPLIYTIKEVSRKRKPDGGIVANWKLTFLSSPEMIVPPSDGDNGN